jgi:hypothetical protein
MFSPIYVAANIRRFLDHEWIDIPILKQYLDQNTGSP